MIQEYRKASAEILGLTHLRKTTSGDDVYMAKNSSDSFYWHPDTDLNQMGMIEDLLIEQGYDIIMHYSWWNVPKGKILSECTENDLNKFWIVKFQKHTIKKSARTAEDKSKPIAFMKAFMEYIKS